MPLPYTATPIQQLLLPEALHAGINILVKREDLNHTHVSGNKWWKLKYNLATAMRQGHQTVLTFGGAYSNHIYATAAAANRLKLTSIAIVRGEETRPLNHTLSFAKEQGMHVHYVSRETYRQKETSEFLGLLHDQFGSFYQIPEGGTNLLAIQGVAEFARQLAQEVTFDYVCLPVGTGGTMAGMIAGLEGAAEVIGISVLKNGAFLSGEVAGWLKKFSDIPYGKWRIETSYHHGGYAKHTPELRALIEEMKTGHALPLDAVYTAKMVAGVRDLIRVGAFNEGSTVLLLHTGGLQGQYN
ncbi:MAG: pyridoxal-phosphate dependent enzyme [Cyclobacteriaceae bacterium]|jgi:1-aminocyclopropane-1-carboxylate deaminase|nr:pyridoxal-phosphate dependent enzyme [Cyclobacteriaceae bacterium]